jgi:hypothetical protein
MIATSRSLKGKVIPLRESSVIENAFDRLADARKFDFKLGDPQPYPLVSTLPRLPVMIPDEILDYYGWVFCQGGFVNLQMTFEQFLAVVAAVSPSGLCPEYDPSEASYPNE